MKASKQKRGIKQAVALFCLFAWTLLLPTLVISETLPNDDEKTIQEEISVDKPWEKAFDQQIKTWMKEISAKESQFQEWMNATYETYPFGPGSKQWVVIVLKNNQEIGYFIVGQASDQPIFELIEYGQSEWSVLSTELRNNPVFLAEDFFYHGLLLAKKEDNTLVDLLTQEKYDHVSLEKVKPFWSGEMVNLLHREQDFVDDPKKEPVVFITSADQTESLNPIQFQEAHQYFYRAKILPDVTGLYKVSSIHYWQGMDHPPQHSKLFIGLEDEGTRYLSYQYLEQLGSFSEMKY